MKYNDILNQYRGNFTSLDFHQRSMLLLNLLSDLKKQNFTISDLDKEVMSDIASIFIENTLLEDGNKDSHHYVSYMIYNYFKSLEIAEVTERKEKSDDNLMFSPENEIDLKPEDFPKAKWDYKLLGEFGSDDIDG